MPYCSNCGVEVDVHVENCPLCLKPIQRFSDEITETKGLYPERPVSGKISGKKIRLISWLAVSIFLLSAFLIVLAIDLIMNGRISWSGYAMTGIGVTWLYSSVILFFLQRPAVIIIGNFIATNGLLVLIDVINGSLEWYLTLGLPISGMVALFSAVIAMFAVRFKTPGVILSSIILILAGVFCIGIELLVSGYLGSVRLSWSFIVLASIYPLAIFLLFYHFILRKRFDVKSFFHV